MTVVQQGRLKVYVSERGDHRQPFPINMLIDTLPKWCATWFRVEHLHVGAGPQGKVVSAIFHRRVLAEERTRRFDGSIRRKPVFGPDSVQPTGPFKVVDYMEVPRMAVSDVIAVRLSDGKETDNTGWKRTERADGKVFFTKTVDGKLYVLDRWAAMSARIHGSLMNTPGYVAPGAKSSTKLSESVVGPTVKRRVMEANTKPVVKTTAKPVAAPARKSFSHGDILSRKAKELMTPGRKAK